MEFTGERFVPHLSELQIRIEHLQRYYAITELVKGKKVLDAACGEGYGTSIISETAAKVIGIDISNEAIDHARSTYMNENLSYQMASIEALPFESNSIDVVVSFETIEHVNEELQQSFLKEIKRVLREDGLLIISTPNKHMYSDIRNYQNPFHVKEFYKEEYREFLGSYFEFVEIFHQKNEVTSVITNFSDKEYTRQVKLDSEKADLEGTYFIAICSNEAKGDLQIGSSVLFADKYNEMLNRILSLQDEVDERNKHIKYLDEKHAELHKVVITTQDENHLLKQEIVKKSNDCDEILRSVGKEYGIQDMNLDEIVKRVNTDLKIMRDHDQELMDKEGHINLLLESERELDRIQRSTGWKLLTKYYRLRDKVIPRSSKRRLVTKLVSKTIREPRKVLKNLNKNNLKKLRYYLNTEDAGNIESRIDNFMDRHKGVSQLEIKLVDPNQVKERIVFPKFEVPLVSIIIPVYNQWDYTYSCLKSILLNTEQIPYEIIIADDMSNDETTRISDYIDNAHVVRDGINRGFLLNCNNAAKQAKGKYIFFLNNDTNVQENWLKYLVDLVENNSKIGMVGSKLVYPDGRLQEAGGIIWNDASGWNYGRLADPSKPEYNYVKDVDYISGAAIMIRAEIWKQIGGFDERYVPAYFEDSDLAFEVRKHGYRVVLQPKSVVVHFEGISHGTDTGSGIKSYQINNKVKFQEKWGKELIKDQFENAQHIFVARDRTKNKKTILVIDHYVPHFDKDAGSRTVFQYLKLFVNSGFNVKFIGDNFFQHEPYTSILEELGIEVLYGEWYSRHWENWIKNNSQYIDFVFMNRPHISEKYMDTVKRYTNAKVIYYGHDLHYLRELREYELSNNSKLLESSHAWKKRELELCRKADFVYYPSQVEVDELSSHLPNQKIKAIPAYIYENIEKMEPDFSQKENLLFVGGFGHKPNIDAVKWFIQEIFPTILQCENQMKLYIVGSNPPEEVLSFQSENVIVTGFVSDEELNKYYLKSKIVVVPLRYGAGVKGKVVEAMYHQLPIVTTSIGAEGLPELENYVMISDDPKEFARKVIELYNNESLLTKYSENSFAYVQAYFSEKSVLSAISADFNIERK